LGVPLRAQERKGGKNHARQRRRGKELLLEKRIAKPIEFELTHNRVPEIRGSTYGKEENFRKKVDILAHGAEQVISFAGLEYNRRR